ncbi:hypothetical protein [Bacillus sp. Bva_UNVM-123]|uniref:hypothetical protein n=1 Tax=Bacillus sp. Bva_UNVM-123 TaxID=2829798 RepID=UPI00391F60DB
MTTYDNVYELFLSKVEDFELQKKLELELNFANEVMFDFLKSAIPKFTYSVKDLSNRDDILLQFNFILSEIEKEILATLMVVEYLSPKILRDEFLESRLGSKDYREFSPANQLKELKDLRKIFKDEANLLMIEYYYRQGI